MSAEDRDPAHGETVPPAGREQADSAHPADTVQPADSVQPHSAGPADSVHPPTGPVEQAVERVADALDIKPRWRGWIHAGASPFVLAAGVVLVILAPSAGSKISCAIYVFTAVLMFVTSAVYHRRNWRPRTRMLLKRLDHTNIMLVIAGTYTPVAYSLLEPDQRTVLLSMIWAGAILGVLFRVLWVAAPRLLYVPVYVALGAGALFYLPEFTAASVAITALILVGGALYIAGAVFYALKRPNFTAAFGFHELFHAFTVVAFAAHYIAIVIAVLGPHS